MIAKICASIIRAVRRHGLLSQIPQSAQVLIGSDKFSDGESTEVEKIADSYENSWQNASDVPNSTELPSVDRFKEAIEDFVEAIGIQRIVLLIDEAAHIFCQNNKDSFSPFLGI